MIRCRLSAIGRIAVFSAFCFWASNAANADEQSAPATIKGDGGAVRLLVNLAGTQSYPPYVIQKLGLDKKYGFVLQTLPSVTTQTTTTAFQSGGADIGIMGWNDLSRVKAGGVNVVGIAPFLGWATTIIVPVNSPVHTLGDFKGKKIGVYSRTGLDWVLMRAAAQKVYKLDLEKDVVMNEGTVSLLRGLMEQGQLDATQMFNDLTSSLVVSGKFTVMARVTDFIAQLGLPETPFIMYVADMKYAAAHPDNVKAFLAAYRESVRALQTNDDLWTERAKELNVTDPAVVAGLREGSRPMLMTAFTPATEANIRKTWDILVATAGAETLGQSKLVDDFMTVDYQ